MAPRGRTRWRQYDWQSPLHWPASRRRDLSRQVDAKPDEPAQADLIDYIADQVQHQAGGESSDAGDLAEPDRRVRDSHVSPKSDGGST